jgi:hypothetical protein
MGMGGGKGAMSASRSQDVPAASPPQYIYQAPVDTAAVEAAKTKEQKALLLMKGRQSTILTGNDLGVGTTGRPTLSGA